MDLLTLFYSIVLILLLFCKDASSAQVTKSVSPSTPVLGDNNIFTLQCNFVLMSDGSEKINRLILSKKTATEDTFTDILEFPPNTSPNDPVIYKDKSLENRTVARTLDNSSSPSASLTFNNTLCSDKAEYKWTYSIYAPRTGTIDDTQTSVVNIKVPGTFRGQADYGITFSPPSYDVIEETQVTFTCKADVGTEPQGQLEWYYYLSDIPYPVSDKAVKEDLVSARNCSYSQQSRLMLTMNSTLDGILVRCTLRQDDTGPDGDTHNQTNKFSVKYSPRDMNIITNPVGLEHSESLDKLTFSCVSRANPAPSYSWKLPNGTEVDGQIFHLYNLQINDTGTYTCIARNEIPDANSTATKEVTINIEKTTTTESTTPSSATESQSPGGPTSAPVGGGDDESSDKTIIIIIVCVVVGVGIIVGIVVAVIICNRKKKPEIEEPPEKPRNNQDLTFYGNRPGLTTSSDSLQKSGSNLNTSFNSFDSSDSKPHNDDGLMYVDLQFDDKPRSRRPIQLYDNNSTTQYADIAMPRV